MSAGAVALAIVAIAPLAARTDEAGTGSSGRAIAATGLLPSPAGDRAWELLHDIVDRSRPPEYRRFGSPGMAASADLAAAVLADAGLDVLRHDVALERWAVDYAPGRAPLLERVADGHRFKVDSLMTLGATSGPDGITCTVREIDDVGPGDCGFVPFEVASPEWNNFDSAPGPALDTILSRGGIGAVIQGDVERDALIALRLGRALPTVVAVAARSEVVGHEVRLRAEGRTEPATARNVIGFRRPTDPGAGWIVLQAHLDGWYEAAADNAAGAAAVLAAAEALAGERQQRGLLVALYDAEEWGLQGSQAFAEELSGPPGVDLGDCGPFLRMGDLTAVINIDASSARASDVQDPVAGLIGTDLPLFSWRVLVASEEPVLTSAFFTTMAAHGVLGLPLTTELADVIESGMRRTDARWFHEAGVPVAWPVAGYPEYHTDADTIDAVDRTDLAAVTDATAALARAADVLPIGPILGTQPPERGDGTVPAGCGSSTTPAAGAADGAAAGTEPGARTRDARGSEVTRSDGARLPETGGAPPQATLAALAMTLALLGAVAVRGAVRHPR